MKDDLVYVGHMLDTARSVAAKVQGVDRTGFDNDENLRLAVTHLVQIIGEAAARVPEDFRRRHLNVPWQDVTDLRNRLIHGYDAVNFDILWTIIEQDLPPLIEQLQAIVQGES